MTHFNFLFLLVVTLTAFSRPAHAQATLLKDIRPGESSGLEEFRFAGFTTAGDLTYFGANDGEHGFELWVTDGTESGTRMVRDLYPGPDSGNPEYFHALGDKLVFFANDGEHGFELWVSDGTEAGTVLLKDILAGWQSGVELPFFDEEPTNFRVFGDYFYFASHNGNLWRTDGTPAGTALFKALDGSPHSLIEFDSLLYFSDGMHIWRTDGTPAGTEVVYTSNFLFTYSFRNPVVCGDRIYFDGPGNLALRALWKTDGTAAGTQAVADLGNTPPTFLTCLNDSLVFFVQEGRLWRSDGTAAGTAEFGDYEMTPATYWPNPTISLYSWNDRLYFNALNPDNLFQETVYVTDGTEAGTQAVYTTAIFSEEVHNVDFVGTPDHLYFIGYDTAAAENVLVRLPADTAALLTYPLPVNYYVNARNLTLVGDCFYFQGQADSVGYEPFKWVPEIVAAGEPAFAANAHIAVWPNPSFDGRFRLAVWPGEQSAWQYDVFDQQGRRVARGTGSGPGGTIDLSPLADGWYIIEVRGAGTSKVLLKRH